MKQLPKLGIALLISLFLCIPSSFAVFYFSHPMDDASYDLSLLPDDDQVWEGSKGWNVYIQTEEKQKALLSDGSGGYSGLDYAGQTFYFSRKLTEELVSPALRIGAVNRTISIFLDDDLIYTDCPELDNRIGYLNLPMLEYDRMEPVIISLPLNYEDKVLTIAQSSPVVSETLLDDNTVYPSSVILYCDYSYESGLIAETAKVMIPAVLLFALEIFLLVVFIWNASSGHFLPTIPILALTVLFQLCSVLVRASFYYKYLGNLPVDLGQLLFYLSVIALMIFLTIHTKQFIPVFTVGIVLQVISVILFGIAQINPAFYGSSYPFFLSLPGTVNFLALGLLLIFSFFLWRRGNTFYRHFCQAALVIMTGYTVFLLVSIFIQPDYFSGILSIAAFEISNLMPNYTLKLIWQLCLYSSLFAILRNILELEATRRTESTILAAKTELAIESYENLRRQSEEVMMIRHDISKHYGILHTMAQKSPEKIADYINELENQILDIRSVVSSGNQILDIILNGKISTAKDKGVSTEIIRCEAPEQLPLHDTELCCLIMNIMDNAINAASDPMTANPYIRLDTHCKDNHFVFSCENSMPSKKVQLKRKFMPDHGYGLKIVQKIMERWGEMISVEQDENRYKVSIIIPLN